MNVCGDQHSVFYRTDGGTLPLLAGNGELVTAFGPTGYHADGPIPQMQVFALAGRRIHAPTAPLVRFGQLRRTLKVEGKTSESSRCEQELVPSQGVVLSRNKHESVDESTISFVCMDSNSAGFRTTLTNTTDRAISGQFVLEYRFGDWDGKLSPDTILHDRPIQHPNGAAMRFEVDKTHLGAVELLCSQTVEAEKGPQGFQLRWSFELESGGSKNVDFLFGIGDKRRFRYTPRSWSFDDMLGQQKEAWAEFHGASTVELGEPELEALRRMCLYTIRCNSTPWSVPPCVSPAQWEGRTFHDELYPFLGLVSGGHVDLAKKIPNYRLNTLPKAVARTSFRGAKFPWESLEDGEDGSPYGHWLEEHFHMGQFAETAWQLCLYSEDPGLTRKFYSLLREMADYYLLNLVEWNDEIAWIRPCTDYDEAISPVENGMYTACAAIRSMELAARVGGELGEPERKLAAWKEMSEKLRRNLPASEEENRYKTAAVAAHRHIAEVGPVFPFRIDRGTARARNTLDSFCQAVRTQAGLQPGDLPDYGGSRWLWTAAHVSTAYSILGNADRAHDLLKESVAACGPGMTPVERVMPDGGLRLPFFTTGAGAYLFALHNLFVQVTDDGVTRLPALPRDLMEARYERLAGARGVLYSARITGGKVESLTIGSPACHTVGLMASERLFPVEITDWQAVSDWHRADGYYHLNLALEKGRNVWTLGSA